jgi:hypothetical protein
MALGFDISPFVKTICINSQVSYLFIYLFVANAFISHFNKQTMHIKSFYTQQHCYVSLKTLYPGGETES